MRDRLSSLEEATSKQQLVNGIEPHRTPIQQRRRLRERCGNVKAAVREVYDLHNTIVYLIIIYASVGMVCWQYNATARSAVGALQLAPMGLLKRDT